MYTGYHHTFESEIVRLIVVAYFFFKFKISLRGKINLQESRQSRNLVRIKGDFVSPGMAAGLVPFGSMASFSLPSSCT